MLARGGIALAVIVVVGLATLPDHSTPAKASTVPTLDHVFVIVMENHGYNQIVGSSLAPYINGLAASGGLATSYYAVTHPSLPNYLALAGGSTYGITSDCTTCWVSATNIADRIESGGKTWKTYQESMPSACFVGDSYPYAQKHNPFIYFNDIRTNTSRCQSHVVPYSQMSSDLASTSTTPNFAFITPNMCSDMHDCTVDTGDSWLSQNVPQILTSPAFTTQRSLLMLVWDEDDFSGSNQVAMIAVGSGVTAGLRSVNTYNHYSALRTVEDALGLATLTTNDASASPMTDFFSVPTPTPTPTPTPMPTPTPTPTPPPPPPPPPVAGWSPVGGIAASGPAVTSWGSGRLDVFVRGTDHALWHRSSTSGVWSAWESLGGILTADPSAVTQGVNSLDVFVRGTDNGLWHRSWNGSSWTSWDSLGGIATSRPAAASWGPGRLDVIVRGTDGGLWHRGFDGTAWGPWDALGGIASSEPAAVASQFGRVDVVVQGTDNGLWHRALTGSTWGAWEAVGGVANSNPAISSCGASGHLDVFVIGTDHAIWRRGFNASGWTVWSSANGTFEIGPAASCASGTATVQLIEVAPDESLVQSSVAGS